MQVCNNYLISSPSYRNYKCDIVSLNLQNMLNIAICMAHRLYKSKEELALPNNQADMQLDKFH